jgi:hypothetical protein
LLLDSATTLIWFFVLEITVVSRNSLLAIRRHASSPSLVWSASYKYTQVDLEMSLFEFQLVTVDLLQNVGEFKGADRVLTEMKKEVLN